MDSTELDYDYIADKLIYHGIDEKSDHSFSQLYRRALYLEQRNAKLERVAVAARVVLSYIESNYLAEDFKIIDLYELSECLKALDAKDGAE